MAKLTIICTGKNIDVDAEGFTGISCEEAVSRIDELMQLKKREDKAEKYVFDNENSDYAGL